MGIDYSASSGYGFVLKNDEDWEAMAGKLGVAYEGDDYEVLEALCSKYQVDYATAGDSYSGEVQYLIGDVRTSHIYDFQESDFMFLKKDDFNVDMFLKLEEILSTLELDRDIKFYTGLHVY